MIFTARQLEQLQKSDGQIVLPYRARLTPLAQDWIRQRKIKIGYSDVEPATAKTANDIAPRIGGGNWMWWADSPCGPAKAALASVAPQAGLQATEIGVASRQTAEAVKALAAELKAGRADGGILLVGNGASAMIFANRCHAIRAVLGTCIEAVDQGVRLVAANVLVLEHPYKTIQQAKTLLSKFVHGKRELSEEVKRQLQELRMRIGKVVGRVTLMRSYETLAGGRFLIVEVQDRFSLAGEARKTSESVVVYDHFGAHTGDLIAFAESREATMPFYPEKRVPLDAYNACILEAVVVDHKI